MNHSTTPVHHDPHPTLPGDQDEDHEAGIVHAHHHGGHPPANGEEHVRHHDKAADTGHHDGHAPSHLPHADLNPLADHRSGHPDLGVPGHGA